MAFALVPVGEERILLGQVHVSSAEQLHKSLQLRSITGRAMSTLLLASSQIEGLHQTQVQSVVNNRECVQELLD